MRTPADLPRRLPRASRRTRIVLLVGVVVLIVLITSLSGLARFWTDYLWFQSVGFTSVFRGVLLTKVVLALVFIAIFFVLLFVNLVIADRVAPEEPAPGVRRRAGGALPGRGRPPRPGGADRHRRCLRPPGRRSAPTGSGTTGICCATTCPSASPTREYPQGRRLLRLRAAVHQVPARLGVRGPDRGADRHRSSPTTSTAASTCRVPNGG